MVAIGSLEVDPPYLNSSSPWASDLKQLAELYSSAFTGAVTTRTATLNGFEEDPNIHTVSFAKDSYSSINSYGYSPRPLNAYIEDIKSLFLSSPFTTKPIIISITSSDPVELREMLDQIAILRDFLDSSIPPTASDRAKPLANRLLGIELNTSCPNIPGKPPPSYDIESLLTLLTALDIFAKSLILEQKLPFTIGLKLPPYVYSKQFEDVAKAIKSLGNSTISFITCTNTLGSNLLFSEQAEVVDSDGSEFALPTMYGGIAGDAIHALSLGNVKAFSDILKGDPEIAHITIIGVGGVNSPETARRMFRAGAGAVACATALGKEGVSIFQRLQS